MRLALRFKLINCAPFYLGVCSGFAVFMPLFWSMNSGPMASKALVCTTLLVFLMSTQFRVLIQTRKFTAALPKRPTVNYRESALTMGAAAVFSTLLFFTQSYSPLLPLAFGSTVCTLAAIVRAKSKNASVLSLHVPMLALYAAIGSALFIGSISEAIAALPIWLGIPLLITPFVFHYRFDEQISQNWKQIHDNEISPRFAFDMKSTQSQIHKTNRKSGFLNPRRSLKAYASDWSNLNWNLIEASVGTMRYLNRRMHFIALILVIFAITLSAFTLLSKFGSTISFETQEHLFAALLPSLVIFTTLAGSPIGRAESITAIKRIGRNRYHELLSKNAFKLTTLSVFTTTILVALVQIGMHVFAVRNFRITDIHNILLLALVWLSFSAPVFIQFSTKRLKSTSTPAISAGSIFSILFIIVPPIIFQLFGSLSFERAYVNGWWNPIHVLAIEAAILGISAYLFHSVLRTHAKRTILTNDF